MTPLMITAEWAEAIGTWAAALATFAAVSIALFEVVRTRRPRVKVRCARGVAGWPGETESAAIVTVTNDGFRPVKVTSIALLTDDAYQLFVPRPHPLSDPVPALLQEGESINWFFNEDRHIAAPIKAGGHKRVVACQASDSAGRIYYGRGFDRTRAPLRWIVYRAARQGRKRHRSPKRWQRFVPRQLRRSPAD